MKSFFLLTIPFLLLPAMEGVAQYRRGYVVNLNGDSVRGWVKFRDNGRQISQCDFRTTRHTHKVRFLPDQIRGFGLESGGVWVAKVTKSSSQPELRFLAMLVSGKTSLFKSENTFYIEKDSLEELEPPTGQNTNGQPEMPYITKLNRLIAGCDLKANSIRYSDDDLSNLIQNFNLCSGHRGTRYKAKLRVFATNLYVITGAEASNIKTTGLGDFVCPTNTTPMIGAGIEFSSPSLSRHFKLTGEGLFSSKHFKGYLESSSPGAFTRSDLDFRTTLLKIPIGIKYEFNHTFATPFLRGGISAVILINPSAEVIHETESPGIIVTTVDPKTAVHGPIGIWVAAGYQRAVFHDICLFAEVRVESFSGTVLPSYSGRNVSVLLGIRF